jgi:hypothetical protein
LTSLFHRRMSRRGAVPAVAALVLLVASTGCGNENHAEHADAVTTDDPYLAEERPYPYVSELQRGAVSAYLGCMSSRGIALRGPYVDYRNRGMVFKPKGQPEPLSKLRRAGSHCPQNLVAIFLGGASDDSDIPIFRRASIQFARCMRTHEIRDFPLPRFGKHNAPYPKSTRLLFDWNDPDFAQTVNTCRQPLESVFYQ